nr:FtsW/RodA/SpoVE family cell cycle protein [Faecalitalea cylindroides]
MILFGLTSFFSLYNAFNLISDGSGLGYLGRQIMWYIIGFGALTIITMIQNEVIYRYIRKIYNFLLICLAYLFISSLLISVTGNTNIHLPFAPSINGSVSWFQFPIVGSFQPSEFIKIVLIIMTSQTINIHQDKYPEQTWQNDLKLLIELAKILLPPLILIFLQPDTGLCLIICFNTLVLLMCSGIKKQYVWILAALIILFIGGFFFLYFQFPDVLSSFISAYRLQRIESWLDPESYITGSSNQLYTALLSLGSAGLTGYGLQANIIAIPEAHTDFIFAAIGQCFGLLGTTFILFICMLMDLYLCKIAYNTKNKTDRFIVIGIISMLLYQQIQNLGMIVGLLPITGITLPLISYGGSSILSYFIAFGIIMNISPLSKNNIKIHLPKFKKFKKIKRAKKSRLSFR